MLPDTVKTTIQNPLGSTERCPKVGHNLMWYVRLQGRIQWRIELIGGSLGLFRLLSYYQIRRSLTLCLGAVILCRLLRRWNIASIP